MQNTDKRLPYVAFNQQKMNKNSKELMQRAQQMSDRIKKNAYKKRGRGKNEG